MDSRFGGDIFSKVLGMTLGNRGFGAEDVSSLRNILDLLPEEQRLLAVAYALNTRDALPDPHEIEQNLGRVSAALKADQDISATLAQVDVQRGAESGIRLIKDAVQTPHFALRQSGLVAKNSIAAFRDGLLVPFIPFGINLQTMAGLPEMYESKLRDVRNRDVLDLSQDAAARDILQRNVSGMTRTLEHLEQNFGQFPVVCRATGETIKASLQELRRKFLGEEGEGNDPMASLRKMLGVQDSGKEKENIPLYRGNLLYTAFLYEIVDRLPNIDKSGDQKMDGLAAADFCNYLQALADPRLLSDLKTSGLSMQLRSVANVLYESLSTVHGLLQECEASKTLSSANMEYGNPYQTAVDLGQKESASLSGKGGSFDGFSMAPIEALFRELRPDAQSRRGAAKVGNEGKQSDKEKAYLDLFEKVEDLLYRIIHETGEVVTHGDFQDQLEEIAKLRADLIEPAKRETQALLKRDKEEKNVAFTVSQNGGMGGGISLEQVPTARRAIEDLRGESWREVFHSLETLLDYADFGHIHTTMTPRGKANNNMLLVGPYGCGKNMFLKALMSDPRLIGVNMTTDRILSMWYGEAERNLRSLFEDSQKKREEYDLPVVIGWDEFDSLFERKGEGMHITQNVDSRLQKLLQSIMEGDTVYEGVSLVGLTNEPRQIPVAVYRRFSKVHIIQPLTGKERRDLIENGLLAALPLEEGFSDKVRWDQFEQQTEYASGDTIGKIFDAAFQEYTAGFKMINRPGLKAVNAEAKERSLAGQRLTNEERLNLFLKHGGQDVCVTADGFMSNVAAVLGQTDVSAAISQQKLFYRDVEDLMKEAFGGSI